MRIVVCFLLLPWLPALAFVLLDADPIPVVGDRIVVIVFAGLVAALTSAALAWRAKRKPGMAALRTTD